MNPTRKAMLLLTGLLAGCASGPQFDTSGVDTAVTPRQAVAEAERLQGRTVLWSGVVIDSTNLADATRLEVLAYPLGGDQGPDLDREPLGRFLVRRSGYLEPVDYHAGRAVTVLGRLAGTRSGKVGQAAYEYPLVDAERIHLWPAGGRARGSPQFHIGVGVVFGN